MSPSFYRVVAAYHIMLHRAKKRAVTTDDIQNLLSVHDVPKGPSFYKVQYHKPFAILGKVTSKHRYPLVWVSEYTFGAAPHIFGPVADFPVGDDVDNSELALVVRVIPDSGRQGSIFKSPNLMATTGWFVNTGPMSRWFSPHEEAPSESESEAEDSTAPSRGAGGT